MTSSQPAERPVSTPLQVKELYDEASIAAVLQEWFRTFQDLPLIIRQSVQLGLFSSAQLVRFLCMDVRPGLTRKVTRVLSPKVLIVFFPEKDLLSHDTTPSKAMDLVEGICNLFIYFSPCLFY